METCINAHIAKNVVRPPRSFNKRQITLGLTLFTLLLSLAAVPAPARASDPVQGLAPFPVSLSEFRMSLPTADPNLIVGVYSPGLLALPVVQQPGGQLAYVSNRFGTATQFRMASDYGSIGLLAHNTLSGADFFNLSTGSDIVLIFGDGRSKTYRVVDTDSYKALSPRSPYSDFINLETDEPRLSAETLFRRIYQQENRLVLQTCIEAEGNVSWGRLFVIAVPVEQTAARFPTYETARYIMH
jgi:hypothetical protein